VPPADAEGGNAVLTVSDVAVRFGGVAALNEVSLSVKPGTVTGLIGPNGAGKTTLFNVISGLQTPGRGSVRIFDTDVTGMKPHRRARLGLARTFQRLELFGSLKVSDNVKVGLESDVRAWDWRRLWGKARRRNGTLPGTDGTPTTDAATCEHLLAGCGLEGLGGQFASSLPTGSARMVELARALAIGPKLLLLDEPGSGLDETETAALGDLLATLAAGGMAVLLVEHDMELVMRICHHIYVLDFGDIIASGPPDEIRQNPVVQAAYLGEAGSEAGSSADVGQPAGSETVS
jgi:branched-chain amino acid transport system ATP-binding protein